MLAFTKHCIELLIMLYGAFFKDRKKVFVDDGFYAKKLFFHRQFKYVQRNKDIYNGFFKCFEKFKNFFKN